MRWPLTTWLFTWLCIVGFTALTGYWTGYIQGTSRCLTVGEARAAIAEVFGQCIRQNAVCEPGETVTSCPEDCDREYLDRRFNAAEAK